MVVVVVGILVVLVDDVLAIEMIVKAMSLLWFFVFGIGHQQALLNTSMPGRRPGSSRASLALPKNPIGMAWRVRDGGRIGLLAWGAWQIRKSFQ
jgi:L-asparaginase II